MKAAHGIRALAFVFALALAPAAYAQSEPPRRPQGPAASPIIKLPPGAGAVEERTPTNGARNGAATASLPKKWEYCYIKGFAYRQTGFSSSSPRVALAYVRYLPEGSEEIEGGNEEEALGNALAKLGEDGWELTTIQTNFKLEDGYGKTDSVYYFKRPKNQE